MIRPEIADGDDDYDELSEKLKKVQSKLTYKIHQNEARSTKFVENYPNCSEIFDEPTGRRNDESIKWNLQQRY